MKLQNKTNGSIDGVRDGSNILCFDPGQTIDVSDENAEDILGAFPGLKKEGEAEKENKKRGKTEEGEESQERSQTEEGKEKEKKVIFLVD